MMCTLIFLFNLFVSGSFNFAGADAKTESILKGFDKKEIQLAHKKISVFIADSNAKHSHGLMDVLHLDEDQGMLFIFRNEDKRIFWMKNTKIPLSIGFFDKDKRLLQTLEMTPEKKQDHETKLYESNKPAQYVLEMNRGWFTKNKIKVGSRLEF